MNMMSHTFALQSPRLHPRAVGLASRLMSVVPLVLFGALTVQSFFRIGLLGWSVGIAYILYDTALLGFTALQIRPLAKGPPPLPLLQPGAARPSMGVIVAAHNEAPVLGVTIDGIAAQESPPELILLADDGSSDDSADVLARLYGLTAPALGQISPPSPVLPSLRWLRLPHGGKARALNAAIGLVDNDLVLTIDADTLLEQGALKAMRDAFAAEPELVAATGILTPICGSRPHQRLFEWFQRYEYVRNFLSRYAWMGQNSLLLISGAFAAFRRRAVIEVGGFDPECMVEDYELIHRLHRHAHEQGLDWRVRVIGGAMASTDAPATPMGFLRQRRRWFGGFLQTQHWNRDMVANPRYGVLGTRMLTVKALDTIQPIYGMTAFFVLVGYVALGRAYIAPAILAVMLAKVLVDLTFHLWSIKLYTRWTGHADGLGWRHALAASFLEPFSFQLLRHAGACWGWVAYLRGGGSWGRQQRTALGHHINVPSLRESEAS